MEGAGRRAFEHVHLENNVVFRRVLALMN
jgi:hypothetical protein